MQRKLQEQEQKKGADIEKINTLKRKDLKSFDLLPSLSVNSKKLKYKVSYRINFRLFNIWLICRIN